jgi:hypothetical protein
VYLRVVLSFWAFVIDASSSSDQPISKLSDMPSLPFLDDSNYVSQLPYRTPPPRMGTAGLFLGPPPFCGVSSDVGSLFRCQTGSSSLPALATKFGSVRIAIIFDSVLDLPGGDIDDQLTELNRVARALESTGCHVGNMAWRAPTGNPASRARKTVAIQSDPLPAVTILYACCTRICIMPRW